MKDGTTSAPRDAGASWEHIHQLFATVRGNLARLQQPDDIGGATVLRRRAELYANGLSANGEAEEAREDVLQFSLGSDTYAIPCSHIEEVIPMQNLVALPHTEKSILGISSNRGLLFVVVDLKRMLSIPASELTTMHRLVIVRHEQFQVGLLVDVVHGMRGMRVDRLRELPDEMNARTRHFLRGITGERVLLLDMVSIVGEVAALGEAPQAGHVRQQLEQHKQVQI
ncbi:MAG: chemotaxis protein CheW [Bacteroidota bacterium]|nr:chemotaxis protein CheW [Bacteroidota bacterium]